MGWDDILGGFDDIIGNVKDEKIIKHTPVAIDDEWDSDEFWSPEPDSFWKNSDDEWRS